MNQEPSVLDFVKSSLRNWRHNLFRGSSMNEEKQEPQFWKETPEIAMPVSTQAFAEQPLQTSTESVLGVPWRVLLALGLGLWAQLSLEPHISSEHTWQTGIILYGLAGLVLTWNVWRHEWELPVLTERLHEVSLETKLLKSSVAFIVSLVFSLIAFVAFKGNLFTPFNITIWFIAIVTAIWAFMRPDAGTLNWVVKIRDYIFRSSWNISISRSMLLFLVVFGFALFFRIYRLSDVPSQMISDHAEKLLDVSDVLSGKTSIFFPRNTGREFFQFYLTATIILLFKTGLSYLSLKIGTVLAGLVALVYIYLLGKEIGGNRVGLFALVLAGIAYWPNVISRYGLRFPLYPLFYAPAIYYLVWGLRTHNRLGFVLSGLFLGLGLHGYSPFRVVPFVILLAVGLYLFHKQSESYRVQTIWATFAIIIISFIVFLPLFRYMSENPDMVMYRAMTRLGDLEQPLPGPAWQIFLQNLWNSLTMFGWSDGLTWPISITQRPALDIVTAAFFHLGLILVIVRYIRQRHWFDLFTLLSIPALMLPSILSLSFPGENPSLNRSAAAIVPVFLVAALALDSFWAALESASASIWNKRFAWVASIFLIVWASLQNYDLVFNQYRTQYDLSAWNTTEMGDVVRSFIELTGSEDTAWLVGYPYWADSRLVMINAGYPTRDNGFLPPNFPDIVEDPRPKLFIVNPSDLASLETLKSRYPDGWIREFDSKYENKNFLLFFVPQH